MDMKAYILSLVAPALRSTRQPEKGMRYGNDG